MAFKLSNRSRGRLNGVHPLMVETVNRAIKITRVDFGVTEGLRSLARQRQMVDQGRSRTMQSYHLPQADGYGHAVDLVAYIDGEICWDLALYDDIADAMKQAAREYDAPIRWGAAWHINNITEWNGTMEEAMNSYIDLRRSQGRRPFIDGPHFELRF